MGTKDPSEVEPPYDPGSRFCWTFDDIVPLDENGDPLSPEQVALIAEHLRGGDEPEPDPAAVTDDDLRGTFAPDLLRSAGIEPKP